MAYIFAIATFISTFVGGLIALRFKDRLHLIIGFSAGALIGLAFFDLMPESISLISSTHEISLATALIALGFMIYMVLDRTLFKEQHDDDACENETHVHRRSPTLAAGSLSIHSFFDGLAIGFGFQVSNSVGLIIALAVLAHDFSDGINTINFIFKSGGTKRAAVKWLFIDALAPVLGVLLGSYLIFPSFVLGILLSLFCGFFLYIGASELLPESYHSHPTWWTTTSTVLGVIMLYIIINFAHI